VGAAALADKPSADNPSTAAAEIRSLFSRIVSYSLVGIAMPFRIRFAVSPHILPRCNALSQFVRSTMAITNRQQINLHQFLADAEAQFFEPSDLPFIDFLSSLFCLSFVTIVERKLSVRPKTC
jgi:hypothetical protein